MELAAAAVRSNQPSPDATAQEEPADESTAAQRINSAIGITVIPSQIGVHKTAVAVSKVSPTGRGAEAGLEVGDVILSVSDQPVTNEKEFAAALPIAGGNTMFLVRDLAAAAMCRCR